MNRRAENQAMSDPRQRYRAGVLKCLTKATRGYSSEAVTDTILRRMHDYVHYICPQFTYTALQAR